MELQCQIYDSKHKDSAYSRTSRKRPSKMQRLSAGRLRAGQALKSSWRPVHDRVIQTCHKRSRNQNI